MPPRIRPIVLILVLCRAALDQAEARVISGGGNVPVNPPVEVGGYRAGLTLPRGISYDIVAGMRSGYAWFTPCVLWSWNLVRPFRWRRPFVPVARLPARFAPLPDLPPLP